MSSLKFTTAVGAVLAAAACNQSQPPAAPPRPDRAVQAPEPRPDLPEEQRSPDLYGTWLVESVSVPNPLPRDRFWNQILLVGSRQLEVISQCVTIGPFDYGRTVGGGIAVSQPPATPGPGRIGTPPIAQCARGLSPAEQALGPLLLAARDVKLGTEGAVTLTGRAGSITLRRPEGVLRNPFSQTPPPRIPPLLGAWRFVRVDGQALSSTHNMELLLRARHVEWRSGCVSEVRLLSHDRNILTPGEIDSFPVCERGRSEAEEAVGRLLADKVVIRMSEDGQLGLEGSGVTAELAPLTR
jgi:hypothetical protein